MKKFIGFSVLIVLGLVGVLALSSPLAMDQEDKTSIEKGKILFHKKDLGSAGKACSDCHSKTMPFMWRGDRISTASALSLCHQNCQESETTLAKNDLTDLTEFVMAVRQAHFKAVAAEGKVLASNRELGTSGKACSDCHPREKPIGRHLGEQRLIAGIDLCYGGCIQSRESLSESRRERLLVWTVLLQQEASKKVEKGNIKDVVKLRYDKFAESGGKICED